MSIIKLQNVKEGINVYKVIDVAKYLVSYCTNKDMPISNLQLQKILYFLQLFYWKKTSNWLFNEEFAAWRYGPVISEVYNIYYGYGGAKICKEYGKSVISLEDCMILKPMIDKLSKKNPWDLVELTHKDNTPWSRVYDNGKGEYAIIPKGLIAEDKTDF